MSFRKFFSSKSPSPSPSPPPSPESSSSKDVSPISKERLSRISNSLYIVVNSISGLKTQHVTSEREKKKEAEKIVKLQEEQSKVQGWAELVETQADKMKEGESLSEQKSIEFIEEINKLHKTVSQSAQQLSKHNKDELDLVLGKLHQDLIANKPETIISDLEDNLSDHTKLRTILLSRLVMLYDTIPYKEEFDILRNQVNEIRDKVEGFDLSKDEGVDALRKSHDEFPTVQVQIFKSIFMTFSKRLDNAGPPEKVAIYRIEIEQMEKEAFDLPEKATAHQKEIGQMEKEVLVLSRKYPDYLKLWGFTNDVYGLHQLKKDGASSMPELRDPHKEAPSLRRRMSQ